MSGGDFPQPKPLESSGLDPAEELGTGLQVLLAQARACEQQRTPALLQS